MTREELLRENEELKTKLANAKLELDNLKRVIFGTKREYTPEENSQEIEDQWSFFDNEEDIENDVQEQIKENLEEITVYRKKNAKKKKAGIKKELLKNIVVERKEYVLEDGEVCPECQSELKAIGKKNSTSRNRIWTSETKNKRICKNSLQMCKMRDKRR